MERPKIDNTRVMQLIHALKTPNCSLQTEIYYDKFVELYKLMEPLLRWCISGDLTKVYSTEIIKRRYSVLNRLEKKYPPEKPFSFSLATQRYLKNYIDDLGFTNIFEPNSLFTPFWEVLNSLSLERIEKDTAKYHYKYSYYLLVKFCDKYWNYVYRCVRRDLQSQTCSLYSYDDKYTYEQYCISELANDVDWDTLRNALTQREQQVWDLLLKGYTHVEIGKKLDISPEYSRKIKERFKKRLMPLLHHTS